MIGKRFVKCVSRMQRRCWTLCAVVLAACGANAGLGVSPGKVTAVARVLHSIDEIQRIHPGEILVTRTTTPAWTPLFAQIAGLVTDLGGPLAHGSIVAREVGIPAVMGTGNATQKILDGELITLDGALGTVIRKSVN